ncbi:Smr/MutS family protein [Desulfobacterales bacterium HSG16]|nr:Smr/MutS family protein [Desulfobacterales bacterium HSG16]
MNETNDKINDSSLPENTTTEYENFEEQQPIVVPIEDSIDLHTFRPKEIPDLLLDYFLACTEMKIFSVRVIHGKGKGILRKRVHEVLKKNKLVKSFKNAPQEAGSWGATLVKLKKK